MVVASRPVGAGTALTADDLKVVQYPAGLLPASTSSTDLKDWVGLTLSTAMVEGQPLTTSSVVGPDLLAGQPTGTTAVTVRVADPGALTHLRPGQRVDLIHRDQNLTMERPDPQTSPSASDDESGSPRHNVVAHDVTVLWVADPTEPATGLLSSSSGESNQDLLVVGADADTAQSIAAHDGQELVPVLVAQDASAATAQPQ